MARLSPDEERKMQAELHQKRQREAQDAKEGALNRVRSAAGFEELRDAVATYLETYS